MVGMSDVVLLEVDTVVEEYMPVGMWQDFVRVASFVELESVAAEFCSTVGIQK